MISKNVNLIFQPQLMLKKIEKKKLSFLENRKNEKKKNLFLQGFFSFVWSKVMFYLGVGAQLQFYNLGTI